MRITNLLDKNAILLNADISDKNDSDQYSYRNA